MPERLHASSGSSARGGVSEQALHAEVTATHSAGSLTVRFRNTLNGTDATNESVSQASYELWFR